MILCLDHYITKKGVGSFNTFVTILSHKRHKTPQKPRAFEGLILRCCYKAITGVLKEPTHKMVKTRLIMGFEFFTLRA